MEYGPPPLFRQGVSARLRFIFYVVMCVVLMLVDGRFRTLDGFRSVITSLTTPVVEVLTLPKEWLESSEGYFVSKAKLTVAVNELTAKNKTLSLENVRLHELEQENHELRRLLAATSKISQKSVTAEVIGWVADQYTRRIKINIGNDEGIKVGMPVLSSTGIVGQISRVVKHQAEITLLIDHRQQISVINERTNQFFLLQGTGDQSLDMRFVPPKSDVQAGDKLVTSGLDRIFPKNIPVGRVLSVNYEAGETYQTVSVSPVFSDLTLQFVTVILVDPEPTRELDEAEKQEMNSIKRRAGR